MVKGINRQVIVVKATDTSLFEQAIFLLREDALEKDGVGEHELLEEAQRIANTYVQTRKCARKLSPYIFMALGAAPFFVAWLVTWLIK